MIVLLDFAENFSFIVQDAVQGFYWENSQCTLHPFVVYCNKSGYLECISLCIISDSLLHDPTSVHSFITRTVPYIQEKNKWYRQNNIFQ